MREIGIGRGPRVPQPKPHIIPWGFLSRQALHTTRRPVNVTDIRAAARSFDDFAARGTVRVHTHTLWRRF